MQDNFNKLSYFLGRICTVLVSPTAKRLSDKAHANCFTGLVESIDEYGIWITQLNGKFKSFLAAPIIGIVEEDVELITHEEAEKIRNTAEAIEQAEQMHLPQVRSKGYISVEEMEEMARKAKEKFKKGKS